MSPPNVTAFLLYFFLLLLCFRECTLLRVTRVLSVAFISCAKVKVGQELFTEALNTKLKHIKIALSLRLTEC